MSFGKLIRKKRNSLFINSAELGLVVGVSGNYILLIEKGRIPTEELLAKVLVALNVTNKEKEDIYTLYDNDKLSERVKEKIKRSERLKKAGIDTFTEADLKEVVDILKKYQVRKNKL